MTLSDLITEYLDKTKDPSTANRLRGIRRINAHHRRIASRKNYFWLEKALALTSVSLQQSYNFPVDYDKLISDIRYNDGTNDTITQEIISPTRFDEMNRNGTDISSDYPIFHHIRNNKLYLFPVPATSSKTIGGQYKRKAYKMTLEDVTDGTVAVTNASATVQGTTTDFVNDGIVAGVMIEFDGDGIFYEVSSVTDADTLVLTRPYEGSTASGLSYRAGHAPILPEAYHDLCWIGPVIDYYLKKGDKDSVRDWREELIFLQTELDSYSQSETGTNVINKRKYRMKTVNEYPVNIG